MARLYITIPYELMEQLYAIATSQHRYPRQEAERLLYEAIAREFQALEATQLELQAQQASNGQEG